MNLIINNWTHRNLHQRDLRELTSQKNTFPPRPKWNETHDCPPTNAGLCTFGGFRCNVLACFPGSPARLLSWNPAASVMSVWTALLHYDPHSYRSRDLSPPPSFSQPRTHFRSCSRIAGRSRPLKRKDCWAEARRYPDQESSTTGERRPRLRRAACVNTAVCVCVKRQEWVAEADSPTPTPESEVHRNTAPGASGCLSK